MWVDPFLTGSFIGMHMRQAVSESHAISQDFFLLGEEVFHIHGDFIWKARSFAALTYVVDDGTDDSRQHGLRTSACFGGRKSEVH